VQAALSELSGPSSQVSPAWMMPSLHSARVQALVHSSVSIWLPSSHSSIAATMPSPHAASAHRLVHSSSSIWLPSSQPSPGPVNPSPHTFVGAVGLAGVHVAVHRAVVAALVRALIAVAAGVGLALGAARHAGAVVRAVVALLASRRSRRRRTRARIVVVSSPVVVVSGSEVVVGSLVGTRWSRRCPTCPRSWCRWSSGPDPRLWWSAGRRSWSRPRSSPSVPPIVPTPSSPHAHTSAMTPIPTNPLFERMVIPPPSRRAR
jgi:hypothetical protein